MACCQKYVQIGQTTKTSNTSTFSAADKIWELHLFQHYSEWNTQKTFNNYKSNIKSSIWHTLSIWVSSKKVLVLHGGRGQTCITLALLKKKLIYIFLKWWNITKTLRNTFYRSFYTILTQCNTFAWHVSWWKTCTKWRCQWLALCPSWFYQDRHASIRNILKTIHNILLILSILSLTPVRISVERYQEFTAIM